MPYKGNPDAKRIKSSDHIADLKRQIAELQRQLDDAIFASGRKAYYIVGELHRLVGPAVIGPDGYEAHYINGERHNPDGPAVIYSDGSKSWYINGKQLTEEEFNARTNPKQPNKK